VRQKLLTHKLQCCRLFLGGKGAGAKVEYMLNMLAIPISTDIT